MCEIKKYIKTTCDKKNGVMLSHRIIIIEPDGFWHFDDTRLQLQGVINHLYNNEPCMLDGKEIWFGLKKPINKNDGRTTVWLASKNDPQRYYFDILLGVRTTNKSSDKEVVSEVIPDTDIPTTMDEETVNNTTNNSQDETKIYELLDRYEETIMNEDNNKTTDEATKNIIDELNAKLDAERKRRIDAEEARVRAFEDGVNTGTNRAYLVAGICAAVFAATSICVGIFKK